jgi:hypothetical protein
MTGNDSRLRRGRKEYMAMRADFRDDTETVLWSHSRQSGTVRTRKARKGEWYLTRACREEGLKCCAQSVQSLSGNVSEGRKIIVQELLRIDEQAIKSYALYSIAYRHLLCRWLVADTFSIKINKCANQAEKKGYPTSCKKKHY